MEQRRVKQRSRLNLAGPRIQQIRNQQGLSQEMLSARCEAKGIILSRSTLAKIETQVRCLTDIELVMIARALRVKLKDIFFDL
jgi:DNA-binding XRE family transcriptional regulator